MDILDDMGVSKLSAKVFFKKWTTPLKGNVFISCSGIVGNFAFTVSYACFYVYCFVFLICTFNDFCFCNTVKTVLLYKFKKKLNVNTLPSFILNSLFQLLFVTILILTQAENV